MARFTINLLLIFFSIFFTIIILEIITRIYIPQKLIYYKEDVWKPHNGLGWNHYKNIDTYLNPGGGGGVRFITDTNGFRIGKNEKEESDYKVVIIGDSFLEAFQVENEYIIPSLINEKFIKEEQKVIKFYNTAVSGWNPNHYLIETKNFLKNFEADLALIFLYSGNDLVDERIYHYKEKKGHAHKTKFTIPKKINFKEFTNSILLPINDILERKFHLFILFKKSFETTLSKVGLTHYEMNEIFKKNQLSKKKSKITSEICNEIKNEFYKNGINSIFIILPAAYQVDKKLFSNYVKGFNINTLEVDLMNPNKLLKKDLLQYKINLLDPIQLFTESYENGDKTHGDIDRHFNKKGHELVSDFLYPFIKEGLL